MPATEPNTMIIKINRDPTDPDGHITSVEFPTGDPDLDVVDFIRAAVVGTIRSQLKDTPIPTDLMVKLLLTDLAERLNTTTDGDLLDPDTLNPEQ